MRSINEILKALDCDGNCKDCTTAIVCGGVFHDATETIRNLLQENRALIESLKEERELYRKTVVDSQVNEYVAKNKLEAELIFSPKTGCITCGDLRRVFDVIEEIRSDDVAPVVFCKHCDLWDKANWAGHKDLGNYVCACAEWSNHEDGHTAFTGPEEYCSRGIRRESDETD